MPRRAPPLPGSQPMFKGQRLTNDQIERLDQLLLQQNVTGLTDTALCQLIPCSRQTIIRRRKALAAKESRERAATKILDPTVPFEDPADPTANDLLAAYPDVKSLTPHDSMRLLSILALTSVNPTAQVNALTTLERLRSELEPADEKAPRAPLTLEEKVQRTIQVLDAAGIEIVQKAITTLWPDAA